MSTAIPELIALELVSRLEQITTANSFAFDVTSVDRVNRDGKNWTPRNLGIGVAQSDEVRNEQLDHEGNPAAIGYSLTFNIHAFVRHSDGDTAAEASTENKMVAAIKKAVAGTSDWHNFGGNAVNADWRRTTPFISANGENAGSTVPLIVHYRISETDPTQARA